MRPFTLAVLTAIAACRWKAVSASSPYTSTLDADNKVEFFPVTTRCLRAVFDASTDETTFAAVGLQEWEVYATRGRPPRRPSVKGAAIGGLFAVMHRFKAFSTCLPTRSDPRHVA
jgi:hypothetical protein